MHLACINFEAGDCNEHIAHVRDCASHMPIDLAPFPGAPDHTKLTKRRYRGVMLAEHWCFIAKGGQGPLLTEQDVVGSSRYIPQAHREPCSFANTAQNSD